MNSERQVRELTVQLPSSAPMVRITAGMGSAGQKTWNLRRPVTLIGAKRPAHIVLHDPAISNAHCVVVNTGSEILLKDLSTSGGTFHNGLPVDCLVLKDGDLLRLGEMQIQVAISSPELRPDDSGCGLRYADPTRFALPIHVKLAYTEMRWQIESAVALIGRHEASEIRLDHPDLSPRHAVLFRFEDGPAIFDISDKTGILVNDQRCSLTPLMDGDQVTVGPFALVIARDSATANASLASLPAATEAMVKPAPAAPTLTEPVTVPQNGSATAHAQHAPPVERLSTHILESWKELNAADAKALQSDAEMEKRLESLKAREAELDARDAALRGKLHDVTRYHEQVLTREREINAMAARVQAEKDELAEGKSAFEVQQQQIDQRLKKVQRREHMVSQRWSRLQSITCPRCGQGVNLKAD